MLSLAPASPYLRFPLILPNSGPDKFPTLLFFPGNGPRSWSPGSLMGVGGIVLARNRCGICGVSRFVRRCGRRESDGEEDSFLESEILEFMKGSENPSLFPTKKQLLDAGRADLVEAISVRGGWLSLGWDLDCDDGRSHFLYDIDFREEIDDGVSMGVEKISKQNQRSRNSELESGDNARPSSLDTSHSRVSLESLSEINSGIEGILSRLEKERNVTFGVGLRDRGGNNAISVDDVQDGSHQETIHETVAGSEERINPTTLMSHEGITNGSIANFTHRDRTHLGTWRTWSTRRAGFSDFEAAEIDPLRDRTEASIDFLKNNVVEMRDESGEQMEITGRSSSSRTEISHDNIKSRLQHLQTELSSVLHSLRSNSLGDEDKSHAIVSEDLRELSDAWEFQENEVMNAQDRLRSIRAKIAVLEGKMAMAIIDAQKTVEEKQKRIEETRRALRLLRTACIVWPNSASEVLLSGSFDGWSTQRRMEKSSTGIFSLCLKLYPGKYEIKFIVDGTWRIDPLRPIVNCNGYENNLLIIT